MGPVIIDFDCLLRTVDFTGARKTGLTGICWKVFRFDTAVTCLIQKSKHRPGWFFTFQCFFCIVRKPFFLIDIFNRKAHAGKDSCSHDFTVMIDTAADCRTPCGNHFLWDVVNAFLKLSFQLQFCNTDKNVLLQD